MARRRKAPRTPQAPVPADRDDVLLCESAWEVCNQVGGIYTVVRSKSPYMVERWGDRYCLLGPYYPANSYAEFEECDISEPFASAVTALRDEGIEVRCGRWLVTGRPQVILISPESVFDRLADIKYRMWEEHQLDTSRSEHLVDLVAAFGYTLERFLHCLDVVVGDSKRIIAHFHEWMAAASLAAVRRTLPRIATVFTTHATLLGRYLAMDGGASHERIAHADWHEMAQHYNILPSATLEWIAAHSSHVFTTVGESAAFECEHLLQRSADLLLPNGLNVERFVALHEFQNLHRKHKEKIQQFVVGHFFPSYTFDLDSTLFFFTSGRYEHVNKGFDVTIHALAQLNHRMKAEGIDSTVVFFLVTRAPYRAINAEALRRRALMEEISRDCEAIQDQVGQRLFNAVAQGQWPRFDELVDEYWRLRLRRNLQAWKTEGLPPIVTHDLYDDSRDSVLCQLRESNLLNQPEDPVKVVFFPVFVSSADVLLRMDYDQFVRGCHLGVFPSSYEPWGYTPLECIALGVPTITSDLAGFGTYVRNAVPDHESCGIGVVERRGTSYGEVVDQLADRMMAFVQLDRRERITLRNRVESSAERFDWHVLGRRYDEAHALALGRV